MDDAGVVSVLQGGAELHAVIDDLLPGQSAAAGQHAVERLAVDVLHRVIARALELADAEQADDVGVVELLEDDGLALEARRRRGCWRPGRGP